MSEKKPLTNEEILKLVEDFSKLSSSQKSEKHMGMGAFKQAYDVHPEYVLKELITDLQEDRQLMVGDYLASKEMAKHVPTEKPILVTRPGKSPVHIQKKLKTDDSALYDAEKEFRETLKSNDVEPMFSDVRASNMGFDELGNPKVHDPMHVQYVGKKSAKNDTLFKSKQTALKKILGSDKSRVYRMLPVIGPLLGLGAAAMSGDANATSGLPVLGEADDLGPQVGSEDWEIENPPKDPKERLTRLKQLMKK